MSRELEPLSWRTTAAQRQHARDVGTLRHGFALAREEIVGISRVTDTAITEAMKVNMIRAQAEHFAPDGVEHYAYIAFRGVMRMASVVDGL